MSDWEGNFVDCLVKTSRNRNRGSSNRNRYEKYNYEQQLPDNEEKEQYCYCNGPYIGSMIECESGHVNFKISIFTIFQERGVSNPIRSILKPVYLA